MSTDDRSLESRALHALYRNHPDTPPAGRYGEAAKRRARGQREMLLAWAATQPDYRLLACRNLGTTTLAWIRAQATRPRSVREWPLTADEEADCRERPWDATKFIEEVWATLDAERARHAALVAALDFIADWAHDCQSPGGEDYGFLDIEKMARAALDGEPR